MTDLASAALSFAEVLAQEVAAMLGADDWGALLLNC
jgi:hypothetical protein